MVSYHKGINSRDPRAAIAVGCWRSNLCLTVSSVVTLFQGKRFFSQLTAEYSILCITWDLRIVNILSNFKQDAGDDPGNYRVESLISVVEKLIGKKKLIGIKYRDDYELIKWTQNALCMNKYLYSTTMLSRMLKDLAPPSESIQSAKQDQTWIANQLRDKEQRGGRDEQFSAEEVAICGCPQHVD